MNLSVAQYYYASEHFRRSERSRRPTSGGVNLLVPYGESVYYIEVRHLLRDGQYCEHERSHEVAVEVGRFWASPLCPAMLRVDSTLGLLPPSHAIVEAASKAPSVGVTTPPGTGGASRGRLADRRLVGVPSQASCHSHTTQSQSRTEANT